MLVDIKAPIAKGLANSIPGAILLLRREDDSKLYPVILKILWKKII